MKGTRLGLLVSAAVVIAGALWFLRSPDGRPGDERSSPKPEPGTPPVLQRSTARRRTRESGPIPTSTSPRNAPPNRPHLQSPAESSGRIERKHRMQWCETRSDATGRFLFRGCNPGMPLKVAVESAMKIPVSIDLGGLAHEEHRKGVRVVVRPAGCVKLQGWPGLVDSRWRATAYPIDESGATDRSGEWRRGPIGRDYFVYESMRPGPWEFLIQRREGKEWIPVSQHTVNVVAETTTRWRVPNP